MGFLDLGDDVGVSTVSLLFMSIYCIIQVAPVSFVIHAPRCKDGKQVAPNQTKPYFFSPGDVLKSFGICKARNKRNKDTLKTEGGPTKKKKANKSDEEVATNAKN